MSKQAQSPALIGSDAHIHWTKPSLFDVDKQLEDAWCLSRRFDFPSSLLSLSSWLLACMLVTRRLQYYRSVLAPIQARRPFSQCCVSQLLRSRVRVTQFFPLFAIMLVCIGCKGGKRLAPWPRLGTDTSPRLTCGLKNLSMTSLDGLTN